MFMYWGGEGRGRGSACERRINMAKITRLQTNTVQSKIEELQEIILECEMKTLHLMDAKKHWN